MSFINLIKGSKAIQLLIFLGAFIPLVICCTPDFTWANTDADAFTYYSAAKYFDISHPTGAPLFNLINYLIIRFPLGSEFWRLAMVSVIASSITCVLLFRICKKLGLDNKKSLIAPAIFITSGIVVSQSTIVETYALATMLMVLIYYLHICKKNVIKYLVAGVALAIHPTTIFVTIPLLISDWWNSGKDLKLSARNIGCLLVGAPFYAYIFFANDAPYVWIAGYEVKDYLRYFMGQTGMIGGLSVIPTDPLIRRLQDSALILLGNLTIAIPFIILSIKNRIKARDFLLVTLFVVPIVYYFTNISDLTYVYIMPSVAFAAILVALRITEKFYKVFTCVLASLALFNVICYNINDGMLDKNMTAKAFYDSLETIPPNSLVWCESRGWERTAILAYNKDNNTNIQAPYFYYEGSYKDKEPLTTVTNLLTEYQNKGLLYITEIVDSKNKEVKLTKVSVEELECILESKFFRQWYDMGL